MRSLVTTTQEELESFYRFAIEQLANGGTEKTIDELYDQWRYENLTLDDMAENVAAIQASIDDMNNGERGRDAREVVKELRSELNRTVGE
jgi:hypothetical protein